MVEWVPNIPHNEFGHRHPCKTNRKERVHPANTHNWNNYNGLLESLSRELLRRSILPSIQAVLPRWIDLLKIFIFFPPYIFLILFCNTVSRIHRIVQRTVFV
jgi:hypothetical protein